MLLLSTFNPLWVLLLFKFSLDKLSLSFASKLLCTSSLLSKYKFISVSKFIKNPLLSSSQASWASNSSSSSWISFVNSSRYSISVSNAFWSLCKASLPLLVVAYFVSYGAVILLLSSVPPKHFFCWSSFSLEDLQPSFLLSGTCLQNKSNFFFPSTKDPRYEGRIGFYYTFNSI